jgi:H2-forming N5,N10-methylenetetrahydromethanopterin dehydrogenase-like enzyme
LFQRQFLKAAARKRNFQVVVCEGAPHFGGRAMAKSLAKAGIDTILINDSATFAIMARVNKVLLPAHAVLVRNQCRGGMLYSIYMMFTLLLIPTGKWRFDYYKRLQHGVTGSQKQFGASGRDYWDVQALSHVSA